MHRLGAPVRPCWTSYLACADDAETCEDELGGRVHDEEGNDYLTCFNTLDGDPGEGGGEGDDPDDGPRPEGRSRPENLAAVVQRSAAAVDSGPRGPVAARPDLYTVRPRAGRAVGRL